MRLLRSPASLGPALECEHPFGEGRRFVHNELAVRGWARSPAGIDDVSIEIGPTRHAASVSGSDRTHFEAVIDTRQWRPTTTTVTVTALDRKGRTAVERGDVRVEPYVDPVTGADAVAGAGTALHCRPLGPTAPHLPIKVRGWAYSRFGIERVAVFLDGRSCHEALYGLTRPHIRRVLDTDDALDCGYYVLLDPFTCSPGEHVVTVVATPTEGPPVGVSRSFVCAGDSEARRGEIEPSVPAEPSKRPRSVTLDAPKHSGQIPGSTQPTLEEARYRWVAQLTAKQAVLDASSGEKRCSASLAAAGAKSLELADIARDDRLPFEADSFDLLICFEVLDSVEDPERALDELCRVLRKGGLLVLSWRRSRALEPSVRRRFASVRAYRQGEYAGTFIVTHETPEDATVEVGFSEPAGGAASATDSIMIAVAGDAPVPMLPGLALVRPDVLGELRETAAGWKERALLAEADAAAKLTERAQAQRGEERAFMFLRDAEERRRKAERALERGPLRRLRRYLSRRRSGS